MVSGIFFPTRRKQRAREPGRKTAMGVSVPGAGGEKEAEEELDEVDPGPDPKDARPTRLKKKPAWLNDGN
jgi:hypothetical protein